MNLHCYIILWIIGIFAGSQETNNDPQIVRIGLLGNPLLGIGYIDAIGEVLIKRHGPQVREVDRPADIYWRALIDCRLLSRGWL